MNRSQYGKGTDFKQDIFQYTGNNCFFPTSGFVKRITQITGRDCTEEFWTFFRPEKKRVMLSAWIQPFSRKHNIIIAYFDGLRINSRNTTERNIASYIYINNFCLSWWSNGISLNKGIEELKTNFTVVDKVISDKHFESIIEYESRPEKDRSPLINMVVYDIESFNTIKCVSYGKCINTLSKFLGKYKRDITQLDYEKCRNSCFALKGTNCVNETLDLVSEFEGKAERVNNKNIEKKLFMIAHEGSGFESCFVLNNLTQWPTNVNLIKNRSFLVSLKIINGYIDKDKEIPQSVQFRCGLILVNNSLKEVGISFDLQPSFLNQKLSMMMYMKTIRKKKKTIGCLILRTMFHREHSLIPDTQKEWRNWLDMVWKTV